MPLVLADRVRDTTTTTGTGTVTLSGTAPTGYQNFSVIGNGNTTYYTINAGSQWEVGIGTYSSTGPTLARNTVLESSNANTLVDFAAGTKDVFVTYPSDRSVYQDGASIAAGTAILPVANGGTGAASLTSGYLLKGNGTSAVSPSVVYESFGYIGIGTISPGALLDAQETFNGVGGINYFNASTGASSAAQITAEAGGSYFYHRVTRATGIVQFRGITATTLNQDFNTQVFRSTGGSEYMRITAAGDVGIGTSSPQKKLVVSDGGNIGFEVSPNDAAQGYTRLLNYNRTTNVYTPVRYEGSTQTWFVGTAGTTRAMDIDTSGNVGIGTSSPTTKLTVSDGAITAGASGDVLVGRFSSAFPTPGAGYFRLRTHNTDAANGGIAFDTLASSTLTERMRITSAGDVGIGTSSPSTKLDVVGAGIRAVTTTTTSAGSPLGSQIYLGDANFASSFALRGPGIGAVFDAGQAVAASLAFYTYSSATRNERMRLDPNGNLGIGTTSPAAKLDILGTTSDQLRLRTAATEEYRIGRNASTGLLDFYGSQTGFTGYVFGGIDGERMRITAAGNVGIGTSSPSGRLHVTEANKIFDTFGNLNVFTSDAATVGAGGAIALGGNNGTGGTSPYPFAKIQGIKEGATNTWNGALLFGTTAGSSAITERMRIDSSGNVGIGTTSPVRPLDVNGAIRVANASNIEWGGDSYYINGNTAGSLTFGTAGSDRMAITSTGSVGIGVTSPGTTFDVALSTTGLPGLRASRSAVSSQYIQMDIGGGASARLFATGGNKAMYIINNNSGAGLGTATDSTFIQVPGPTANTPITAMYLESSTANVGIGTTAPAGRVHAVNTYTNTSNTNFIADGNIPGLNLRPANGRFSLLASYGAANTSSIVLGTGTANPSTEAMRFDHSTGGINVGAATPNAAAQLQVDSTTRGFLPPRMTTAQRDAIATPPNGLVLYNTSTDKLQVRAAGAWVDLH